MKLKPSFAAVLVAASITALGLSACGGGSSSGSTSVVVANPAAFSATDTTVGTGAEATAGKTATVTYTGWLYSTTATNNKGTQFDSGSFSYVVGGSSVIPGFDRGVTGMKVGGKRTVLIPSSLGYGTGGSGAIPANAGLVFDIELTAVK
ncbi:FKBP-type peptidyl-prolyl cis-trans isomerase [Massilia forsythiae]|uniref:Peptidyl-prolyl cis-trans isomerase n=1 Tax=Massilia forsythiae TaxID=2728020 RepID=A0A7Z2VVL2_9BURK|nr:FKBP-type peptidyl-prolyl cis-trans isomerase [Massilia forsythiae]QJD99939.1 FKBP-type peptidyl-prolyl cis-trans isomerase [Massilia forsythiae]